MRTVLKIAWRSIWRNRRRTLISMGAVGIGLLLVIFYGGLMDSMLGEAKEQLDNVGMGHVEITATNWRAQHRVTDGLEAPGELLNRLDLPAGSEAGYRVVTRGLISSARGSEGVELQGVDWNQEERLSLYVRDVRQGQRPAPDDERGMLIGEKLAQRLHVDVGAKVRIMVQRADGEIGAELYRVRGLFHSMSPAISQRRVLVSASSARNLLGVENVGHQVVIQLEHAAAADHEAQRLREKLGTKYEVLSYGEILPALRTIERMSDSIIIFAALFIYGLVGLGILNTMLMSVLERNREFGVLRAIGTRPGRVVAQVLGESFWIGTLGAAFGLSMGLALTWYGSHHAMLNIGGAAGGEAIEYAGTVLRTAIKTKFSPASAFKAAALVYVMALLTALYPAWKVARMSPAQALRSN